MRFAPLALEHKMTTRNSRRALEAYSLIELAIVIVITAVFASMIVPKFQSQSRQSRESALKTDLSLVRTAVAKFEADTGFYPQQLSDLVANSAPSNGYDENGTLQSIPSAGWHGPYVSGSLPKDPVSDREFRYTITGEDVGSVTSSATGKDLQGTPFSTY